MGKFKLTKQNVEKIKKMLEHQVNEVKRQTACAAYNYFMNFAYKMDGGGYHIGGDGWTLYYLTNWNVAVNGTDESVTPADRLTVKDSRGFAIHNAYQDNYDPQKAIRVTSKVAFGDTISVTNSVEYGETLNKGGSLEGREVKPNRFIEQAEEALQGLAENIIQNVERHCPEI